MKPEKPAPNGADFSGKSNGSRRPEGNAPDTLHQAGSERPIDLEALGVEDVPDYYHAPSERFLVRNPAGRWQPFGISAYRRLLLSRGLDHKKQSDGGLSTIDWEILKVQQENDVHLYGPLCGRNAGFHETPGGTRYLVTEDLPLIEPKPGEFPTILAILTGLYVDSESAAVGDAQFHTVLGWLKSTAEALRSGRQQQQQAIATCGESDSGKSLVQHRIFTPCISGRSVDAQRYFLRDGDFNSDLFSAEHLTLDDCRSSTSLRDRLAFAAKLKGCTVGAAVKSCHAKGKDAVNVSPWWRVSITANDDPESLIVLPPLNEDFADKLILLRGSRFKLPLPVATQADKDRFANRIDEEIPAFLFWLLNIYQIPEQYRDPRRYGIATFHHPILREILQAMSPEAELLDLIDLTLATNLKNGPYWITAQDLKEKLRGRDRHRTDRILNNPQACGQYLHRLSQMPNPRVEKSRTSSANGWTIFPKPHSMEGMEGNSSFRA